MTSSYAQIEGYWDQAGGNPSEAPVMAAIAEAESSGNNVEQSGQPYATTGWGLWQITPGDSDPSIGVDSALLNPLTNAKVAVQKEETQGLSAWTTYTDGEYLRFMQNGVAATSGSATDAAATSASSSVESATESAVGSSVIQSVMTGLGVSSVQDLFERGALMIFGAVLVVIGLMHMTTVDNKVVHRVGEGVEGAAEVGAV
jgi:hypothetical protein